MCPVGDGSSLERWTCLTCSTRMTSEQITVCTNLERRLEASPVDSLEAVEEILSLKVMHPSHHLLFSPSEELAYHYADVKLYDTSRVCWERVISCAAHLVPGNHHEKVIYHDHLAQVLFCLGRQEEAMKEWETAFQVSVLSCGEVVPSTLALGKILKSPPVTMTDLMLHYPPRS